MKITARLNLPCICLIRLRTKEIRKAKAVRLLRVKDLRNRLLTNTKRL